MVRLLDFEEDERGPFKKLDVVTEHSSLKHFENEC